MQTVTDTEALQKIGELIREIQMTLFVTQDENGRMHARPMQTQKPDKSKPFDGELWFLTSKSSPKVREIEANPNVLLSYAEPKSNSYVSVAGTAEAVEDRARIKDMWHEPFRIWFPDGPEDPDITLIRVKADAAEYWDSPSKGIVYAFGYFKMKLTGEVPDVGENRKVRMK
jgi:general stress protein 26